MKRHFQAVGVLSDVPHHMISENDTATARARFDDPWRFWRFRSGEWTYEGEWNQEGAVARLKECDTVVYIAEQGKKP